MTVEHLCEVNLTHTHTYTHTLAKTEMRRVVVMLHLLCDAQLLVSTAVEISTVEFKVILT